MLWPVVAETQECMELRNIPQPGYMCDYRAVAGCKVTFNWFMMILKNDQSLTDGKPPVQDLQLRSGRHRIRARFDQSQVDTSTFFLSFSHAVHLSHQEMIGYVLG